MVETNSKVLNAISLIGDIEETELASLSSLIKPYPVDINEEKIVTDWANRFLMSIALIQMTMEGKVYTVVEDGELKFTHSEGGE